MITPRLARRGLVAFVAAALFLFTAPSATASDNADSVEPYERDVFVIIGSTLRNPDETTANSANLYNVAGVNLGRTWGQWKAPTPVTTSVLTQHETYAVVRVTFKRLRANGVYSVFYGTIQPDSENPKCPGVERTRPVRSTNASQSPDFASFVAKSDGTASFTGRIPGHPLNALQLWISIVWHSNRETYGSLPNKGEFVTQGSSCRSSFGDDAMRQFLILQKW